MLLDLLMFLCHLQLGGSLLLLQHSGSRALPYSALPCRVTTLLVRTGCILAGEGLLHLPPLRLQGLQHRDSPGVNHC